MRFTVLHNVHNEDGAEDWIVEAASSGDAVQRIFDGPNEAVRTPMPYKYGDALSETAEMLVVLSVYEEWIGFNGKHTVLVDYELAPNGKARWLAMTS